MRVAAAMEAAVEDTAEVAAGTEPLMQPAVVEEITGCTPAVAVSIVPAVLKADIPASKAAMD